MKKYVVSFDVETDEASLNELEALLGPPVSSRSHDKRDKNGVGEIWKQTRWSIKSQAEEGANLEEQLSSLLAQIPLEELRDAGLPVDCSRLVTIGVLHDSYTCSVHIPPQIFSQLGEYDIGLGITCYPTEFSEE